MALCELPPRKTYEVPRWDCQARVQVDAELAILGEACLEKLSILIAAITLLFHKFYRHGYRHWLFRLQFDHDASGDSLLEEVLDSNGDGVVASEALV